MVLVDDVLAHYPDNVYFLNNKGALLANNGKEKEALAVFMKIHKINPTDDIVTSNIAYINMQLGNKGEQGSITSCSLKVKMKASEQMPMHS